MSVHTVRGPLDTSELGQTLIHEHITTADWSTRMGFGEHFYEHDVILARAVEQFSRAKACGVRTVVDGPPVNMGRDVRLIREVADQTGLNFIVSSGFYYQDEVYLSWRSEDEVYAWLSRECQDGIARTGIRPGIMKAACADNGITPILDMVFRAIGRVAAEQRLPIFCHHHTQVGNGDEIMDAFESRGVAPSQVVLGHSGDTNDLDYLERMLRRGCYLGMDRFGHCAVSNSLEDRGAPSRSCAPAGTPIGYYCPMTWQSTGGSSGSGRGTRRKTRTPTSTSPSSTARSSRPSRPQDWTMWKYLRCSNATPPHCSRSTDPRRTAPAG